MSTQVVPGSVPPPGRTHALTEGMGFSGQRIFQGLCLVAIIVPLFLLLVLVLDVVNDAWPRLTWHFLSSYPSRRPEEAGILAAMVGSAYMIILTALMAIPVGVGAAVYLEEYASDNHLTRLIELNISNLAGVPSIIYGLLGLELFVRVMQFGRSLLAGSATMALLLLPMVIMASREALRTVPHSLREASYALGADRWQMLRRVVLPSCIPGILTGIILSLARAIGETAPLITIGALTYVAFLPDSLTSPFTVLPIQIFNWVSRPQVAFHANAAAGIVILLLLMLLLNGAAIWLRVKLQRRYA